MGIGGLGAGVDAASLGPIDGEGHKTTGAVNPEGASSSGEGEAGAGLLNDQFANNLLTAFGFSEDQIEAFHGQFKTSPNQVDGEGKKELEVPAGELEEMEGSDQANAVGKQSLSGSDTLLSWFDSKLTQAFDQIGAIPGVNGPLTGPPPSSLIEAVADAVMPTLAPPEPSVANGQITSQAVYALLAEVLGNAAELMQKDKVVESSINTQAQNLKKKNSMLNTVMTQKMHANSAAQRAKAERMEKHGKVMKIMSVIYTVVVAVVMIAMIAIVAVALCVLLAGLGPVAIMAIVLLASVAIALVAAAATLQSYMTMTDAAAEGGMVDDILQALGIEATEMSRMLANLIIQFALGCCNLVAMVILNVMMLALMVVIAAVSAAVAAMMVIIMIATTVLMLVIQLIMSIISSGLLDHAVKEMCMATGMNEEEATKVAFWTTLAVQAAMMVVSIVVAIGGAVANLAAATAKAPADTARAIAEVAAKISSTLAQVVNKVIEAVSRGTAEVTQMMKTVVQAMLAIMEVVQALLDIAGGAIQVVSGALAIANAKLMRDIAELKIEAAEMEYIIEIIGIMNNDLGSLIDMGIEVIRASTEDAMKTMEMGQSVWRSLSRAGSAIHEKGEAPT